MTSRLKVDDARVARMFEEPRRRRLLLSFVSGELSLKQAAEINGMALNLAHYHVRQLCKYGLIEVAKEQRRAGRAVRYYRAKYREYFVPMNLLRSPPAAKLARSLAQSLQDQRDFSGAGVLFDTDESGRPRMREVEGEGPIPLELLRRLRLTRSQATTLFTEIADVIRRHGSEHRTKSGVWTIHVALGQVNG